MQPALSNATSIQSKPSSIETSSDCVSWLRGCTVRPNSLKRIKLHEVYAGDGRAIYRGVYKKNGANVALKSFFQAEGVREHIPREKALHEWAIQSSLKHEHILKAYAAFEDGQRTSLVMEYLNHQDAYSYLRQENKNVLSEPEVQQLAYDTLLALQYLHSKDIVHRDVKTANVFLSDSGRWKLGDFGSAVYMSAVAESRVRLEGTISYLAPEYAKLWHKRTSQQIRAHTTFKLDVWGLGATAYDVMVGYPPFAATPDISDDKELDAIIHKRLAFPENLSPAATSFLRRALNKDKYKRATVDELLRHAWLNS